ncbi:hypothetical protein ACD661_08800 [Legionella lytica]|uniref:DUF86 domain-containing protein n=1 Tax=Legionella lytica TaxID=96232 RepID=A0ABW8D7G7_9GAMM
MSRIEQFEDTIKRLKNIVVNELPGYVVAEQLIQGFEHAKEIEEGIVCNIELLKKLCDFGLPYRDIDAFDDKVIESVYSSFEEMKKLLKERLSK